MESIDFFHGTRVQPPLVIPFYDGKAELECTISEGWGQLIVHSLKCGAKYVRKLKRSIGMVYTEKDDLESLVSGSLGMKGIASLDAQISSKTGTELQLNRSEEIEDEFTFESPKCGERVIALYQFRRNINLKFRDNRLFHKKEWSMSTTYWADRIHDNSYMVSKIPECGCKDDTPTPDGGRIYINMGNVTMATEYFESGDNLKVPALDLEIDKSALHRPLQFNKAKLPDYLLFFTGETPDVAEIKVSLKNAKPADFDENLHQQIATRDSSTERELHSTIMNGTEEARDIRTREKLRADAQRDLILAIANKLEDNEEKDYTEVVLLSLSEILDRNLNDPYVQSYTTEETFKILKNLDTILKSNISLKNADAEQTQQEARAYAQAQLLNAIAEGLEKSKAIHTNLPRHVIALRYLSALQNYIRGETDEKNLQEIKNNFKILQEQIFSKGGK